MASRALTMVEAVHNGSGVVQKPYQKPNPVEVYADRAHPEDYTSIYGYPKRMIPVIRVSDQQRIGGIKEEVITDHHGKEVNRVFYTRDFSRPPSYLRFYDTAEALLIAFGFKVVKPPRDITPKKPAKIVRAAQPELPAPKKSAAKKPVAKKTATPSFEERASKSKPSKSKK